MHKRITPDTDPYMKMVWMLKHPHFKKTLKDLRAVTVKSKIIILIYILNHSSQEENMHHPEMYSCLKEYSQLFSWLSKN